MRRFARTTPEDRPHPDICAFLSHFRGAVREWSRRSRSPAAEMRFTVIPATGPLDRLLLPSIEAPWYRSLWSNLRDFVQPAPPPLDLTSKPVLVQDIWGQYGRQKKSWAMSMALQSAAVLLLFTVASTKVAPRQVARMITLWTPDLSAFTPKPPLPVKTAGGGGGGDRSLLPASKGRLPKAALRQFTPPMAVVPNLNARLTMEPSIVAPPDVILPQVNMAQLGDPLGKLGPLSNGRGSGGGIGDGTGGGVGTGDGPGAGPGSGGGVSDGVARIGRGVSAPLLISKVEPEYSEEARKAKYQGTVMLYVEVDASGRASNIRVVRSLGLGLDEKAIEAVRKWKFKPGYQNGKPVTVGATIEVNFRLL